MSSNKKYQQEYYQRNKERKIKQAKERYEKLKKENPKKFQDLIDKQNEQRRERLKDPIKRKEKNVQQKNWRKKNPKYRKQVNTQRKKRYHEDEEFKKRLITHAKKYYESNKTLKGRANQTNERNPGWKGSKVGMKSLHEWVRRRKPKPQKCEDCKINPPRDLANISQKYKRDIDDFEWLCRKCHMTKDGRIKTLKEGLRKNG